MLPQEPSSEGGDERARDMKGIKGKAQYCAQGHKNCITLNSKQVSGNALWLGWGTDDVGMDVMRYVMWNFENMIIRLQATHRIENFINIKNIPASSPQCVRIG